MDRREFLTGAGKTVSGFGMISILGGCRESQIRTINAEGRRRPNILWIMMDDGRADTLGCYGRPWARTPHMDQLASQGVRFDVAIVQNPVCVPSRKSMKTGYYSHEVGPVAMGKPPEATPSYLDSEKMERLNNVPNLLDAWTVAGTKPVNVGKIHGFAKSWDSCGDVPAELDVCGRSTSYARERFTNENECLPAEAVYTRTHHWMIGGISPLKPEQTQTWRMGDKAVETLKELIGKDEPFFLRVSFHAPHVACRVPKEYFIDPDTIDLPIPTPEELMNKPKFEQGPLRTYSGSLDLDRQQINLARGTYYGMVSLVDAQVGRMVKVLQEARQLDNTIIAINADQGFQLGEHGMWKKRVFYEQNVRVPLILRFPPRLPQSKVIDEPVEMIDLLPTLMELWGLDVPDGIRGRSLMPLIEGKVRRWREAYFCEIDHSQSMYDELRQGTGRRVMVRTREWKMVFFMDDRVKDKDGALYHLRNDPDEKVNLYRDPKYADVIKHLEHMAQEWDAGRL
ncbi:MAG: sulfatase-like hydrolase/transferase [Sedimentisphaerales bacterium]|nr:sulfatase-like hydrolase/transferase [Sedimentisphaerales bacterium]